MMIMCSQRSLVYWLLYKEKDMSLNVNATINLTKEDVEKIVREYVSQGGYNVSDVNIQVGTREVGHQMNSYTEAYFKGIDVKINVGDPRAPGKSPGTDVTYMER